MSNRLLVSSPNGGGIFLIDRGVIYRIDARSATGLYVSSKALLRCFQPSSLTFLDRYSESTVLSHVVDGVDDIHDVTLLDSFVYVVSTGKNQIIKLNLQGEESQRWVFPGEPDSWHINSITCWNGRIIFSAFADVRRHRGYKGASDGAGFVQDLLSGERIIKGLSQPHSLTPFNGNLLIANSEKKEVLCFSPSTELLWRMRFDGYVRGIAVSEDSLYVGLSRSRNIDDAGLQSAQIVEVGLEDFCERWRSDIPANEIYDIRVIPPEADLVALLSSTTADSVSYCVSENESANRLVEERIVWAQSMESELQAARGLVEERTLWAQSLESELQAARGLVEERTAWAQSLESEVKSIGKLLEERTAWAQSLESELQVVRGLVEERTVWAQSLESEVKSTVHLLEERTAWAQSLESALKAAQELIRDKDALADSLNAVIAEQTRAARQLEHALAERDQLVHSLYASRSWRITQPLRNIRHYASKATYLLRKLPNGFKYLARRDFSGFLGRLKAIRRDSAFYQVANQTYEQKVGLRWGVIATRHTAFIGHLVKSRLQKHGWSVDLFFTEQQQYDHDFYVVICPQMFKSLPPGEKRISFQMEQSVSSRWFTSDYLDVLNNSLAVLEYSLKNIEFLSEKGIAYPHVHYLPVGADPSYIKSGKKIDKKYDVLFYGDANSSARRRELLKVLRENFQVKICSEVFGEEMTEEIRQAKVVVNLHYYENALLEMPRIQECISLGVPVISESSQDQSDYPEILGAVRFFAQGDTNGMIETVRKCLESPIPENEVSRSAILGSERFAFMFDRFLVAMGYLSSNKLAVDGLPLPVDVKRVALSMPETIARRRIFEANRPLNCAVFDGVRLRPGWVGCGLSYANLARHALKNKLSRLTVLEDDVLLPADFESKMQVVNEYLDINEGEWDIFAGVIAVLHPDAKVLKVENFRGISFITINRMTSMVCNIYSNKALGILSSWNSDNRDDQTNTIDKYLEHQINLRVVVALPFLVGHREEVSSTLWGFRNSQYSELISNSERLLLEKVITYSRIHARS
ncbi:MAG: DUF4915 domain-containing protein [Pseudomonadota bacterium]